MTVLVLLAPAAGSPAGRPGVAPDGPYACPGTHPIKGYLSGDAGRRLYFLPDHRFYDEASPERCYATEEEARRDGGRPAGGPRWSPPPPGSVRAGAAG